MPELVYPPVIAAAKLMFRALDLRLTVEGSENVPRTGGAVLASNHIGYLDFIFAGLGANPSGRRVRFMAKQQVFSHWLGRPLMRGMRHIPVDRQAGLGSFRAALLALRAGEIVGVFPEATISRSFTVESIKSGAARMAVAAGVPIVPVAVWGTHRMWTKGRQRTLLRRHLPISIIVGQPMTAERGDDYQLVSAELRSAMAALLDRAQRGYPDRPADDEDPWWLPARLGGTAPAPPDL